MSQAIEVEKVQLKGDTVYFSLTEEAIKRVVNSSVALGQIDLDLNALVKVPGLCMWCLSPYKIDKVKWYTANKTRQISALNVEPVLRMYGSLDVPLCTNCQRRHLSAHTDKEKLKQEFPQAVAYEDRRDATGAVIGLLFGIGTGILAYITLSESFWIAILFGLFIAVLSLFGMFLLVSFLFNITSKVMGKFPEEAKQYDRLKDNLDRLEHPVEIILPTGTINTPLLGSKTVNEALHEYFTNARKFAIKFHGNRQFAEQFAKLNR